VISVRIIVTTTMLVVMDDLLLQIENSEELLEDVNGLIEDEDYMNEDFNEERFREWALSQEHSMS
jgi:hypothetical protein